MQQGVQFTRSVRQDTAFSNRNVASRGFSGQLDNAVDQATHALLALRHDQGYWSYELEAYCTIPA